MRLLLVTDLATSDCAFRALRQGHYPLRRLLGAIRIRGGKESRLASSTALFGGALILNRTTTTILHHCPDWHSHHITPGGLVFAIRIHLHPKRPQR